MYTFYICFSKFNDGDLFHPDDGFQYQTLCTCMILFHQSDNDDYFVY